MGNRIRLTNTKKYAMSDCPNNVSDSKNNTATTTESTTASFSILEELRRRWTIDYRLDKYRRESLMGQ